jgi:hypothetical protein
LFVSVVSIPVQNIETNRKKCLVSQNKQTEKQQKQIEFRFFSVRTEKKINGFEDPLIENFLEIFLVCFEKILFVSVVLIPVQNTETNRKIFFGFAKQTEKQPKQIEFRFVSVRPIKKFDCFEDTLQSPVHDQFFCTFVSCVLVFQ